MSLHDLGQHLADDNCLWCVGGLAPAGFHPDLGPVLVLCPTHIWCDACGGTSLFPAEFETLDDRVNEMLGDGLAAIWCTDCNGIAAIIPVTNDGGIR